MTATEPGGPGTPRPLRADARRNRARILAAAEAVFAGKGMSASTEEVAERAGVAIGTVFRHFPTKRALLAAIMKDLLTRLTEEATALGVGDDPGTALFTFFTHVVDEAAAKKTVVGLLAEDGVAVQAADPVRSLGKEIAVLLSRAQAAGTVRRDVRPDEVVALLTSVCQGVLHGGWDDDLRRRTLDLIFAGMRPGAGPGLSPDRGRRQSEGREARWFHGAPPGRERGIMSGSAEIDGYAGRLRVHVFDPGEALARAAARNTAEILRRRVAEHGAARVIVATGNSQLGFVRALRDEPGVPWNGVTVFHMDEYTGISADHPASFRRWIRQNIAEPFRPRAVHYIEGDAADAATEAERYAALLGEAPVDLVCMGIGENGHIAFNEPHQADLRDTVWARVIELDERSRRQQVGEGHFATLDDVPRTAITLTVPALVAPYALQVVVPEKRKAEAVRAALTGPVSAACPASVLREQPNAALFLDRESAALLGPDALTRA